MDGPAAYHLAQFNISTLRQPLDHPDIADFVAGLEAINGLADRSDGFVWRLQTDAGDLTSVRPYDDPDVIVNLSVWASLDALRAFAYRSGHLSFLRRRAEWFVPMAGESVVAWWVTAGHLPDIAEAKDRLERLNAAGSTPDAFSLKRPFPPPA
jgi:heme-degrading monooxygenase HmoA